MPTLAEANWAEQLDAEELGLSVVQVRTMKQNFRAFLAGKMPFRALSRWISGTKDELTARARADYFAELLKQELSK